MKWILLCLMAISPAVFANDELKTIYVDFETARAANDVEKLDSMMGQKFRAWHTLSVDGLGDMTKPYSRESVLKMAAKAASEGKAISFDSSNVSIEVKSKKKFCGSSTEVSLVEEEGKTSEKTVASTVCFKNKKGQYQATKHTMKT